MAHPYWFEAFDQHDNSIWNSAFRLVFRLLSDFVSSISDEHMQLAPARQAVLLPLKTGGGLAATCLNAEVLAHSQ